MPRDISYSDGTVKRGCVVVVWDDLHEERDGFFRAFWADSPDSETGSPVFGYTDTIRGSYRTIREVVREVHKYYPGETVYRNGKAIR